MPTSLLMLSSLNTTLLKNLSKEARETVLIEQGIHPTKALSAIIIAKKFLSAEEVLSFFSGKTTLPFVTRDILLKKAEPTLEKKYAHQWRAIVLSAENNSHQISASTEAHFSGSIPVALVDFENLPLLDEISAHLGRNVTPHMMLAHDFSYIFEEIYGESKNKHSYPSLKQDPTQGFQMLQEILSSGIRAKASDIHIQPHQDHIVLKHRIDGVLAHAHSLSREAYPSLLSALKVAAHMDVGENRKPQHGRYIHPFAERSVDLRMATHPTIHGENVVIRILDKMHGLKSLNGLGFSEKMCADLKKIMQQPSGMIIITGPTGSGKTTTLYALLRELDRTRLNIMTLEDPVEYHIEGIRQTEISQNLSYATGIRSMLRQDPDVILVGEIRDEETAMMALRASMTGHLVLTTLHTPDIFTVPPRLQDFGISAELLAENSMCFVSQRLLRTYCTKCSLSLTRSTDHPKSPECSSCGNTGWQGRISLGEYLIFSKESRDALSQKKDLHPFASLTLKEDASAKLDQGITSMDEIRRVCGV